MPTCPNCAGTVIEYDTSAGNGFCVSCGTVVEENTIVNEVTFGETSTGAAMVQGSYVGIGATRARMGGMYGNRGGGESREQTIANAQRRIQGVAAVLRLSEQVVHAATRLYTLALEHKFTRGRKSLHVVAVCLYVACRQKETRQYMLIDFSDLLQVNVFELGHVYLQLVQALHLQLPLVDPAHHISRFAALLEFGADTARVAADAVRLVQRFDRDWLARGRRPAGVCGAALLLAARMNHFRRSLAEVVQVVKIADSTLQKRLAEFRATPSAQLSLADFRAVWLDAEMDPPAFTRGREREEAERRRAAGEESPEEERKKKKKKKRKRKAEAEDEDQEDEGAPKPWDMPYDDMLAMQPDKDDDPMTIVADKDDEHQPSPMIDPALLNSGILAGTSEPAPNPLFLPEPAEEDDPADAYATPPATMPPRADTAEPAENAAATPPPKPTRPARRRVNSDPDAPLPTPPPTHPVDDTVDKIIGDDVSSFLTNEQGAQLQAALDDADAARLAREPTPPADPEYDPNWADGLDDAELDRFLLNEEEAQIKERVWVELNRDYLEALAAKGEQAESGEKKDKSRKKRRTNNKPRDASTPAGASAADAVRNMVKKNPKYSKRINYDALAGLLSTAPGASDKDDLLRFDDKDEDGMDIVDEDAAAPPLKVPRATTEDVGKEPFSLGEDGEDEDEDVHGKDDFGGDGGWEDAFEQEA